MSGELDARGGAVNVGAPRSLFDTLPPGMLGPSFFDAAADGQRFLMNLRADQSTSPLNVVVHWTEALAR